ncbi:cellulose biosynthesis protein BcsD [Caballeronia sp. LZ025]|uniref:cellulose biosynthesis protein BcsD n=1 Tax=Caballeronia TaxID=1827195 RepID=UPI001FD01DEF|nr:MULTISPECIES: cellulose biosynthesis protein BcsD [Caballeronia]MDR5735643.1 cellulose biosynthesis protein BcsD [Caballeronia sp. LZ025]
MAAPFDYLLDRQISRQWRGLLSSLADEFEAQIGGAELRQLMHRVGNRFADASPLPPCASTADLADALNAVWREADWGFVELSDARDHLRIVHYCAPLRAFGESALAWTPAFLEGAYQHWLSALGAEGLAVRQHGGIGETGGDAAIEFRLAHGAS